MTDEQDWRLKVELRTDEHGGLLDRLIGDARSPSIAREVRDAVSSYVVITHDGSHLFAYSASRAGLETGLKAIEAVIGNEGIKATAVVSHWDERLDEWLQIDPPLAGAQSKPSRCRSVLPRRSNRGPWWQVRAT
jgi:hypothetical protein